MSHAVLCSGPIGGTYALPQNLSNSQVRQLRAQHHAQALLYGGAPSAVTYTPPPPSRGRSVSRAASARPAAVDPTPVVVPTNINILFENLFIRIGQFSLTRTGPLLLISWPKTAAYEFVKNASPDHPPPYWSSKLLALSGPGPVSSVPGMLTWTILCQLRRS